MSKNILRIDASMRKTDSYSRDLLDKLIKQLNGEKGINVKVTTRDLADGISLINEQWIAANFTAIDERTADQHKSLIASDTLVDELNKAELIVIGLPIYNFGVPAAFKAWIDQVVRSKLTFQYTDTGPVGLLNNKKAYIIVASGGTKLGTELDFISDYVRHVLAFIGITDITFIDSSSVGLDESKVLAHAHEHIARI
ncbi:FMN-dependent NADH-azoreductase [Glaciecola sp. 33A]|jgi:FMN-dependent NADH-azoreductase|uniref:FMN-dependent NADH-azoreductase n=1 Tax=Glaciecola sp. 33A TaxID=2057807 RepID=UPI000C336B52|nr:NAD(P)H-dependent oxidoreductase [Glaciecola sp. 33A]PKI03751.1 FMN-dependent NADH-azoreductase [Glaciecola sp. 33A]